MDIYFLFWVTIKDYFIITIIILLKLFQICNWEVPQGALVSFWHICINVDFFLFKELSSF